MGNLELFKHNQLIVNDDGSEYVDGSGIQVKTKQGFKHTENLEKPIIHLAADVREATGAKVGDIIEVGANGLTAISEVQGSRPEDESIARPNKILRQVLLLQPGALIRLPLVESAVLVLDSSGSMWEEMGRMTKMKAVKKASKSYIDIKEEMREQVGLVTFNEEAKVLSKVTNQYDLLKKMVSNISPGGGTDMASGITTSFTLFPEFGLKRINLLADGLTDRNSALEAARRAAEAQIVIDCVGAGDENDLDSVLLRQISSTTGGLFRRVSDPIQVQQAFATLSREKKIPKMLRGK